MLARVAQWNTSPDNPKARVVCSRVAAPRGALTGRAPRIDRAGQNAGGAAPQHDAEEEEPAEAAERKKEKKHKKHRHDNEGGAEGAEDAAGVGNDGEHKARCPALGPSRPLPVAGSRDAPRRAAEEEEEEEARRDCGGGRLNGAKVAAAACAHTLAHSDAAIHACTTYALQCLPRTLHQLLSAACAVRVASASSSARLRRSKNTGQSSDSQAMTPHPPPSSPPHVTLRRVHAIEACVR